MATPAAPVAIRLRRPGYRAQRQHPRPDRQVHVIVVVDRPASSHLRRDLVQRQPDHPGAGQLGGVRAPGVRGPARENVVDEAHHGVRLLAGLLDRRRRPEHHDRPVVDGVMKGGAGQHQPVDQRHRDGQLGTGRGRFENMVGGRPVQQQTVAVPGVGGGNHPHGAVHLTGGVTDEPLVEDGVDELAVVAAPLAVPADGGAGRREERRPRPLAVWAVGEVWPIRPWPPGRAGRRSSGPRCRRASAGPGRAPARSRNRRRG